MLDCFSSEFFHPKIALLVKNLYTDVQSPSSWDRISKGCFGVNLWLADHWVVFFFSKSAMYFQPKMITIKSVMSRTMIHSSSLLKLLIFLIFNFFLDFRLNKLLEKHFEHLIFPNLVESFILCLVSYLLFWIFKWLLIN